MANDRSKPGTLVSRGSAVADPRHMSPNTEDRYQAATAVAKELGMPDYSRPVPGSGAGVTAGQSLSTALPRAPTERTSAQAGVTAGDALTRGRGLVTEQRASARGVKGHTTGSARGVSGASNRMKRIGST